MRQRQQGAVSLVLAVLLLGPATPADSQDEPPLGRSAAFGVVEAGPTVAINAGTALRSRPDPRAEVLTRFETAVELPILRRQGVWTRVHFRDWTGWLAAEGEPVSAGAGESSLAYDPLVIELSISQQTTRLAGARRLLAAENEALPALGPWRLYTDVEDFELLSFLDRVASAVPAAYRHRYGLPVTVDDSQVVVLFAEEQSYRDYTEEFTEVSALHGGGHADGFMAVLFDGSGSREAVGSVLVHELTHLLNRIAFEAGPNTWLEEAIASDLGLSRLDPSGRPKPGTLGGKTRVFSQRTSSRRTFFNVTQTGGQVVWNELMDDWRRRRSKLVSLGELLDLPWSAFVRNDTRSPNYALATFFLRFLLDEPDAPHADLFRSFLTAASSGADSGSEALAAALSTPMPDLERRYERWLTAKAVRAR